MARELLQIIGGGNESSGFVWVVRALRYPEEAFMNQPGASWRNSSDEIAFQLMRAGTGGALRMCS